MQKLKLIIFSDLHYLDEKHKEQTNRKLTKLAVPLLENLINEINTKIKPDICIHLGDLIEDTCDYNQDIENLQFIWKKLKNIQVPFYSIPGNHDLRSMNSREDIEKIFGYDHSTFSINFNHYHFVFLGLDVNNNMTDINGGISKTQNISNDDIKWLKEDLNTNKLPTLIFCHYGLAEDNMEKNWWFKTNPSDALLSNRNKIKEILRKHKNIIAVFSGHQHWTKKIEEENMNYYICGSLTENINNDGIPEGIYLEVEIFSNNIEVFNRYIKL